MFGTTYQLSLNKSYVRHWGVLEAVRELIQNALDSDSPFVFEFTEQEPEGADRAWQLSLVSANAVLPVQSLLLGATTKADDPGSIGSFGEGYKIALLVLTREGRPVLVKNGRKLWRPYFNFSKQFDDDVLCIEENNNSSRLQGVEFIVGGLTESDVAGIRESCLQMQQSIGETKTTSRGRILLQKPGALYVGGLFICKTELKYGYDILPQFITLERDRKTVAEWDLKSMTRDMWFETEQFDEVAKMIEAEVPDVEYARWHSPALVKEACFRLFQAQNPGKMVALSNAELQEKVRQGMTQYVVVGSGFGTLVTESPSYRNLPKAVIRKPHDILLEWYEDSKFNMHDKVRATFREVLAQSKGWKG